MYSNEEIVRFVDLVAEATDPDRIILFGSYAYGNPDDNSDVDLLVIKNGKDFTFDYEAELATAVYLRRKQRKICTKYDVFFRTDGQIQKADTDSGALADALQKGRVVYERTKEIILELGRNASVSSYLKEAEEVHAKVLRANAEGTSG